MLAVESCKIGCQTKIVYLAACVILITSLLREVTLLGKIAKPLEIKIVRLLNSFILIIRIREVFIAELYNKTKKNVCTIIERKKKILRN